MCTLEKRANIYILTLTGPDEHRLNPTLMDSIRSKLNQIRSESESTTSPTALITTAQGKFFSNGYDLTWAQSHPSHPKLISSTLRSLISDLISLPMPTIAAVSGHTSAAGLAFALAHDYVLMRRDRGVLYMSEMDIGLKVPEWIVAVVKTKVGSPMVLREVVLKAGKLRGDKALEMGVVDAVYDGAEMVVEKAVELGVELVGRMWKGHVYAANRLTLFADVLGKIGFDETVEDPNINPTVLAPVQSEAIPRVRKSQRSKNFSIEEDKLIVSAWLNTSKEAITGNEQQGGAFWQRILQYLELHGGNQEERSQSSIKSRWTDINAKCGKFVGFYSQIETLRQSGHTEQNNVDDAKEMFAKIIGKPFQYEHCWNILKMERKWTDNLTSNKRAKTHSTSSPAESTHVESCYSTPYLGDDTEPSSTPNLDRPLGRKASKKQLKNKEKQPGVEASLDHHHWNERMEVERQKVERQDKIYAQQEIALEQHRRQLEIEERQVKEIERQNEMHNEMKIMETDTSGMDPISATYWNSLKIEIMKKRGFNF